MVLTKQATSHRPKRPLSAYFKFRLEKLQQLNDQQNKNKKTVELWNQMDEKDKQKLQSQYQDQLKHYHDQIQEWRKQYGLNQDQIKRRNRRSKGKRQVSSDEQKRKPIRTKGQQSRKLINKRKMEKVRQAKQEKHEGKSGSIRKGYRSKSKQTGRSSGEQEQQYSRSEQSVRSGQGQKQRQRLRYQREHNIGRDSRGKYVNRQSNKAVQK